MNVVESLEGEGQTVNDMNQWDGYLKHLNFDPFEKVLLFKGMDNSILTSCRTLKGQNNTMSDTFKIIHKKFLPRKNTNHRFYKQMMTNQIEKMPYNVEEQTEDQEVAFDFIEEYPQEAEQPALVTQSHFIKEEAVKP